MRRARVLQSAGRVHEVERKKSISDTSHLHSTQRRSPTLRAAHRSRRRLAGRLRVFRRAALVKIIDC